MEAKATNPKDAIATNKLPYHLIPGSVKIAAALAYAEGAMKYGAFNWRVAGVRASVYKSALERHLEKWWEGEDVDPVTGVPHLASVIACAGILLDAHWAGKLEDDRPPVIGLAGKIDLSADGIEKIRSLFKDMKPVHMTQASLAGRRPE